MSFPHSLLWDDCEGFGTWFHFVGPNERFDPPPHPSWQPPITDDGPLYTGVFYYGLDCTRFSHGGFERPLKVFFESADLDAGPDSCLRRGDWAGNVTYSGDALESIWFDDEEVAEYFRVTYGMPAYYADIRGERQPGDPFESFIWTMTYGGTESRFQARIGDQGSGFAKNIRMFWWNETLLGYMDWAEREDYSHDLLVTTWHAEQPLTAADWYSQDAAGTSNFIAGVQIRGEVHLFHDLLCEEPIP